MSTTRNEHTTATTPYRPFVRPVASQVLDWDYEPSSSESELESKSQDGFSSVDNTDSEESEDSDVSEPDYL
jgi:hypothetical protein